MKAFEKDVLTTGEVAKLCNVASRTVSKCLTPSGQIKGYRIPGSATDAYPSPTLISFMKDHGIPLDGPMSGNPRVLVVDAATPACSIHQQDVLQKETSYEGSNVRFDVRRRHGVRTISSACAAGRRPYGRTGRNAVLLLKLRSNDDSAGTRLIAMSNRLTDGQITSLTQSVGTARFAVAVRRAAAHFSIESGVIASSPSSSPSRRPRG